MRDFRDAKAMARTLREALAGKGVTISNSEALELTARMLGARDWNTLAAAIDAARPPPQGATAPASPPETVEAAVPARGFSMPALRRTFRQALTAAGQRRHEYATLELITWTRHPRRSEAPRSIERFRWIGKISSLEQMARRGIPEALPDLRRPA